MRARGIITLWESPRFGFGGSWIAMTAKGAMLIAIGQDSHTEAVLVIDPDGAIGWTVMCLLEEM